MDRSQDDSHAECRDAVLPYAGQRCPDAPEANQLRVDAARARRQRR